jgi:hypothetical protein
MIGPKGESRKQSLANGDLGSRAPIWPIFRCPPLPDIRPAFQISRFRSSEQVRVHQGSDDLQEPTTLAAPHFLLNSQVAAVRRKLTLAAV